VLLYVVGGLLAVGVPAAITGAILYVRLGWFGEAPGRPTADAAPEDPDEPEDPPATPPATPPAPTPSSAPHAPHPEGDHGKIVGVGGKCIGHARDGRHLVLADCTAVRDQDFHLVGDKIRGASGACLVAPDDSGEKHAVMGPCVASEPRQRWTWTDRRVKSGTGKCLSVTGGVAKDGARIAVSACSGKADERWQLVATADPPP
jgi:hypothetical protein